MDKPQFGKNCSYGKDLLGQQYWCAACTVAETDLKLCLLLHTNLMFTIFNVCRGIGLAKLRSV